MAYPSLYACTYAWHYMDDKSENFKLVSDFLKSNNGNQKSCYLNFIISKQEN